MGVFRRKARLQKYAKVLHAMDRAIIREGGVHNLSTDALRKACLIRGSPEEEIFDSLSILSLLFRFKSFKYE